MKELKLHRIFQDDKVTLGTLSVIENGKVIFTCATVELPWRGNKTGVSCVPPGKYPVWKEYSNRFKAMLYELKEVPGRSEVKIHSANYAKQLNGCIALGRSHVDLNGDGVKDVDHSKKTLAAFHAAMGIQGDTTIEIFGTT